MVSNNDKWIRIFDIPDISKHRKGFTIYKVISMLYPETCPDAITKITVWKRFKEFKKIHRELKIIHSKLKLKDKFPSLPNTTFFKRFDDETVQGRKRSILNFLEFIGKHTQLFTSNEFVKFFESSHTPVDQLSSNISSIRANLNLPGEPEYLAANSDDDHTLSDTDSVATLNSLSSVHTNDDTISKSKSTTHSQHSKNSDSLSISTTTDSITLLDGQMYPTPPDTPGPSDSYVQYIIDASIHVNMAVELENTKQYEEAFTAYKTAIDILLKYGKDDKNYDRRQMVRYKTEKFLIKAEKIYNMHLASEVKNLKQFTETEDLKEEFVQRPISDLYKYKVVRILGSGMLVLHSESQQLYYIKVVHKTMKFLSDNLILPENVPYMVKLYNYYNCENALFLVIEYCSGRKIWDYIKHRAECGDDLFYHSNDERLRQVQDMELSDPESEHSYTDLVNDYATNKHAPATTKAEDDSDGSYEKVGLEDVAYSNCNRNLLDEPVPGQFQAIAMIDAEGATSPDSSHRVFPSVELEDCVEKVLVATKDVVKWAAQLLVALEKLHALGITCRNLHTDDLLIGDEGDLKLTYKCNVNDLHDVFSNGKSLIFAPETYSFQPITAAADWWCFGAILYELLVGLSLSTVHPEGMACYTQVKIPKYVSPKAKSLLKQLLIFEPHERLGSGPNGIENLKSHPFFHSVSWDCLTAKCNY